MSDKNSKTMAGITAFLQRSLVKYMERSGNYATIEKLL
jgi:hypothetical protein